MVASIGLVVSFGSSSALAAAYGVAVTTTMVITTILFYVLAREQWKWSLAAAGSLTALFLLIDVAFWGANLTKVPDGGWFPLVVAGVVFLLMTTWKTGRRVLAGRIKAREIPLADFIESIRSHPPMRVPGTAVFMFGDAGGTPRALLHNLKHNKVLHEQVVFLAIVTEGVPRIPRRDQVTWTPRGGGLYSVVLHYGFMEDVNVPSVLHGLDGRDGLRLKPMETTYFLGRETLVPGKNGTGMQAWRERLFAFMSHNARPPAAYFRLPPNQVIEVGARIEL